MTTRNTSTVASRFMTLGRLERKKASRSAASLLGRVKRPWMSDTMAPSNSVPLPTLKVVGEKERQMMPSQMLVTMKRLMPPPRP